MATTVDFADFFCDLIQGCGIVTRRKMFGEYMVYVDGKPAFLICDNVCFVRILPETAALLGDAERGFPYDGAKEHFVLDIDNRELCREAALLLGEILSPPKKKKRKAPPGSD